MDKQDDFVDIFEELTWEMFKLSAGNPYIAQELVVERNKVREEQKINQNQRER